ISTLFAALGPLGFSICRLTSEEIEDRFEVSPLMRWLEKKPEFLIYSILMRPQLLVVIGLVLITAIFFSIACGSLMIHTIRIVQKSKLNSGKSKDLSNAAMRNLFIQFSVFACSLLLPACVFLLRAWVWFDVESAFIACQIIFASHSLASSLVALLINSNYRRSLRFWRRAREIQL
ncbi:hypothetical protein PENTCL1PPCAC_4519, partial [Pristionchus entomophagus]